MRHGRSVRLEVPPAEASMADSDSGGSCVSSAYGGGLEQEDANHYGRGFFAGNAEECVYEGLYRGPVKYLKSFFMAAGTHPDDVPTVFVVVHGFGCNVGDYHRVLRNVLKQKLVKSSVMILSPLFSKATGFMLHARISSLFFVVCVCCFCLFACLFVCLSNCLSVGRSVGRLVGCVKIQLSHE